MTVSGVPVTDREFGITSIKAMIQARKSRDSKKFQPTALCFTLETHMRALITRSRGSAKNKVK